MTETLESRKVYTYIKYPTAQMNIRENYVITRLYGEPRLILLLLLLKQITDLEGEQKLLPEVLLV